MKTFLVLATVAVLAGCAQLQVLSSSDRSVVIEAPAGEWASTQPLADKECAKYGRKASLRDTKRVNYFYDCVL